MLLPPDPPMTRRGPQEVDAEELSGSLLVEEATASSPLKVSRNPPRASQLPAPLGSRAPVPLPPKSLPIDELPTSPLALDSAAPTEASLPPVPPTPLPMVARDAISDSFGESSALPKLPRVGLSSLSPRIRPALGAAVQASRQAIERAVQ
ncbi:MAG: hypothetical protein FWD17_19505, partial [Polyangiaceae bacterium]|nr:hypothetical protein [Polyangiaceae bacterium]